VGSEVRDTMEDSKPTQGIGEDGSKTRRSVATPEAANDQDALSNKALKAEKRIPSEKK